MKRLHVSVGTTDMDKSVAFYSTLFGVEPTMRRDGYAKWMIEDPRVNFVVDHKIASQGVDHLGIQVDSEDELAEVTERLAAATPISQQGATTCCYHVSDKTWSADPQGVAWETFHTKGEATNYGITRAEAGADAGAPAAAAKPEGDACCG